MKIILPSFNIAIEIIEFFKLYHISREINFEDVVNALGKTPHYVKKTCNFLIELDILESSINKDLILNSKYSKFLENGGSEIGVLKLSISNNIVFKEYQRLINIGKTETQAAKFVIASNNLTISSQELTKTLKAWSKYLENEDIIVNKQNKFNAENKSHSFMWINAHGELIYDEKSHSDFIKDQIMQENKNLGEGSVFVDPKRIDQLKLVDTEKFDLSKLIRKCEELNIAYSTQSYFSVGMLVRAIIDHVSPIFSKQTFTEVSGNYGTRSFKDSMMHLDKSSRKIADSYLHTQIRRKETLPTRTQVNFSRDLDVLLGEIVRLLK
jgi:hypothetical protein